MATKGQTFNSYSEEFKRKAVMKFVNGSKSDEVLAEELTIRHCSKGYLSSLLAAGSNQKRAMEIKYVSVVEAVRASS